MVTMRAPNSTPMVRSCTGWNLLSVNCKSRHDFPTPVSHPIIIHPPKKKDRKKKICLMTKYETCVSDDDVLEEVVVRHGR